MTARKPKRVEDSLPSRAVPGFGEDTDTLSVVGGTQLEKINLHDYYLEEPDLESPAEAPSRVRVVSCLGCDANFESPDPRLHRFCEKCRRKQIAGIALGQGNTHAPLHVDAVELDHALHIDPEDELLNED